MDNKRYLLYLVLTLVLSFISLAFPVFEAKAIILDETDPTATGCGNGAYTKRFFDLPNPYTGGRYGQGEMRFSDGDCFTAWTRVTSEIGRQHVGGRIERALAGPVAYYPEALDNTIYIYTLQADRYVGARYTSCGYIRGYGYDVCINFQNPT